MQGSPSSPLSKTLTTPSTANQIHHIPEAIVEIVSDSGEGAQKAGQVFGTVCAKMGNGVWTVEIIPAEIKPPARSRAGASGIRIRFGERYMTNMGDAADLVVAFNEQVLFGRVANSAYRPGTVILLDDKWANSDNPDITHSYHEAVSTFQENGFILREVPIEETCRQLTPNPRLGKNMFVLGLLCGLFQRDLAKALDEVQLIFSNKSDSVIRLNQDLLRAGHAFAEAQLQDLCCSVASQPNPEPMLVTNGNQALGLGVMASGMDLVAMYPITPATAASHYLAGAFQQVGGFIHQAEDEIAAMGFAIGASYAGKTACTITSGPGLALKTELIGLAVMAEIPLVIGVVQRGGPATGLPTKVEQGDLLASLYGSPGDAPKIVMAAATIEECLHFVVAARKLAETFRSPVILLTDANLATGVQPYPRPQVSADWLAPPIDSSPWDTAVPPYGWDENTGLSVRPIPGQRGGEYVVTGLAHTPHSKVAYDPLSNQQGCTMRSRKLATLQKTLKPPAVYGESQGDLLIVGWGSTLGAIQEAVDRAVAKGYRVSAVHLRFLSPLEPGLKEIFSCFKQVMTVEINYSDSPSIPLVDGEPRRLAQLAWLLRAHTLVDIDCWSNVHGQPIPPGAIFAEIQRRLMGSPSSVSSVQGGLSCSV